MSQSELKTATDRDTLAIEHATSEGDNGNAEISFKAGWDARDEDAQIQWSLHYKLRDELEAENKRLESQLAYANQMRGELWDANKRLREALEKYVPIAAYDPETDGFTDFAAREALKVSDRGEK